MKEVTKLLINDFKIKQLNYDFMGYSLQKGDIYTFHHFLIANRENGPYAYWNGVILCGKTSHPYLHLIENKDEILNKKNKKTRRQTCIKIGSDNDGFKHKTRKVYSKHS